MKAPIKTTSRSRVEEITSTLREEILRGQYRPGERLPSERDLAARFEANRGAVREALKKLEQMGITDITPGGVRVVPVEEATLEVLGHIMDLSDVPDPILVGQVLEVMGALISMSARSAVEKANEDQIDAMQTIVSNMVEKNEDSENNQEQWRELGALFAQINKNLVLRLILNGLKTQFVTRMTHLGLPVKLDPTRRTNILLRIEAGISARNAKDVAEAIRDHFQLLRKAVVSALVATSSDTRSYTNAERA